MFYKGKGRTYLDISAALGSSKSPVLKCAKCFLQTRMAKSLPMVSKLKKVEKQRTEALWRSTPTKIT